MPQRILSLEVDAHELKAAILESSFRDHRVVGFHAAAVVPDGRPLAEHLRQFLAERNLEWDIALSVLPGDLVTLRTFYLPFRDRKRLDQTVPFEIETQVPFDLEDVIVAHQVLSRDKVGSTVLAALVSRKDLEEHLALLEAAGVDPKLVDLAPLAALNVFSLLGEQRPKTYVALTGSPARTGVALFRNGSLVGLRTLTPLMPPAPDGETADVSLSTAEESSSPVTQMFSRSSDEGPGAEVMGELARDIGWTLLALNEAPLEEGLPCLVAGEWPEALLKAVAAQGLELRQLGEEIRKGPAVEYRKRVATQAATLGLALREVQPESLVGVNFRRDEFSWHRGQQELRRSLMGTGGLAGVVLLLFLVSTFVEHDRLSRRLEAVSGQLREVFLQTIPDAVRIVDERRQIEEEITAARRRLDLLGSVAPPSGATAIDALHAMSAAVPNSLKVEVDELVMDTTEIKLKARTDSLEAPNAVREAIAKGGYFPLVEVKDIKTGQDGQVDFRIVLSLAKSETGSAASGRQGRP